MTTQYKLTETWVKVAEKQCLIQLVSMNAAGIHVGDAQPASDAAYHLLEQGERTLSVGSNAVVWARALTDQSRIIVTEAQ